MSWIILTRNPADNALIILCDATNDRIYECADEPEAAETAEQNKACVTWGYQLIEVK